MNAKDSEVFQQSANILVDAAILFPEPLDIAVEARIRGYLECRSHGVYFSISANNSSIGRPGMLPANTPFQLCLMSCNISCRVGSR